MSLPTKKKRVLMALCERSYNLFEVQCDLHDRCLHTSVSTLQNVHGILIEREFETVPGFQGIPTRVCRYWVPPDQIDKAQKLAKFWE